MQGGNILETRIDHGILTKRKHLSNDYNYITYLTGAKLRIISGVDLFAEPEEVVFLEDYPKTILIEMKFVKDIWSKSNNKPRYVKRMIPKSALAVGDVKLWCIDTNEPLFGDTIASKWMTDEEAIIF